MRSEDIMEMAMRNLASDLATTVYIDGDFRHAFALFMDFRDAVEALALIRNGVVVPLRR